MLKNLVLAPYLKHLRVSEAQLTIFDLTLRSFLGSFRQVSRRCVVWVDGVVNVGGCLEKREFGSCCLRFLFALASARGDRRKTKLANGLEAGSRVSLRPLVLNVELGLKLELLTTDSH